MWYLNGTKRKISFVILYTKLFNSKKKKKKKMKRKNSLTLKKRNKYQTNRNCHVARDNQIHIVKSGFHQIGVNWLLVRY